MSVCECEFDPYDEAKPEESWHYKRTCLNCGYVWHGLHCAHDGYQNPCPNCEVRPTPVPETDDCISDGGSEHGA